MTLTAAQQLAIDSDSKLIACTAGAGAGKTLVLAERLARLIGDGVMPEAILVVTFTRAAADELRARIKARWADSARRLTVSTIHAWCSRLLRQYPHTIGRDQDFTIYDADDQADIQQAIMLDLRVKQKTWKGATSDKRSEQAAILRAEYQRRLLSWNAVDFEMLLTGAQATLQRSADARAAHRYEHILVDEAQDTAPIPWGLFSLLEPGSLFIVGDYRQAIYSFMGADPSVMQGLAEQAECESIVLAENFRSDSRIVTVANSCSQRMAGPPPDMLSTRHAGAYGGVVYDEALTRESRAEHVAAAIERDLRHDDSPGSIAILARQWRSLEPVADALENHGIDATMSNKKYDPWKTAGARMLLAVLRAATNMRDEHSAREVAEEVLEEHASALRAVAAREGLHLLDADNRLRYACSRVREHTQYVRDAAPCAVKLFALIAIYLGTGRETKAREVEATLELIEDLVHDGVVTSVQDLLDWLTHRDLQTRALEAAGDGVYLGTIHSAKGLEWPRVYLLDWRPRGELEEERRCWYVGATRARDALTVAWYGEPSAFLCEAR